jgi:hypothetical protein
MDPIKTEILDLVMEIKSGSEDLQRDLDEIKVLITGLEDVFEKIIRPPPTSNRSRLRET